MEWIKLSEQLPEVGRRVLLTDINDSEGLVYVGHMWPQQKRFCTDGWDVDEDFFTHWMPFTKPPKAKPERSKGE